MKKVSQVMSREVKSVGEDASVPEVVELLEKSGVWGAPVVDNEGNVVGVLSKTDLTFTATDDTKGHSQLKARDVMTPFLFQVGPDEPVIALIDSMERYGIHRVIVTEGSKPVGVVTTMDLVRELGRVLLGET